MSDAEQPKRRRRTTTAAATPGLALPPDLPPMPVIGIESDRRMYLSELLHGDEYAGMRQEVLSTGRIEQRAQNRTIHVQTRPLPNGEHEIVAIASVTRDPGLTQTYIDQIQDFLNQSDRGKSIEVDQYWNIFNNEGIVNNAICKIAAILSGGGSYVVKRAKKGKLRKAQELLQIILDDFVINVNQAPDDGVVTGSRGLQAVNQQAVRMALVEGDWFGRAVWSKKQVGVYGQFAMPTVIQSITSKEIKPAPEVAGTPIEAFYWVPPSSLIDQITKPSNKDIAPLVKRFIPSDMVSKLKKDRQVFLDPALLLHVKHRGVDTKPFGTSFIKPALGGIAYKRSVESLDIVSMQNLVNRLTIVMVGSSDPKSIYGKADVAAARARTMQQLFETPGPNMTIVWQGDDVKVEDVGAHAAILDLDGRHTIAEGKVKIALGVPEALLSGTTSDGKAAGWAATVGSASTLQELQTHLKNAWMTIGQRIANENGFEDVDVDFQFDNALSVDKIEEWNARRQDYISGLIPVKNYLLAIGYDPDATYVQMCYEKGLEPGTSTWAEAFMPPQGLQGQGQVNLNGGPNPPGAGGGAGAPPAGGGGGGGGGAAPSAPGQQGGGGRPPNSTTGKTGPDRKPRPTTRENK